MKEIVDILIKYNKTISTMESCTGGAVVNEITNIEGSSSILKFSAVTYSNEYKIKMGVDKNIIDKYSVYSIETANEMSKNISLYTDSNYGIGVTGKLNRIDKNNLYGNNNTVFISVYDKDNDKYYTDIAIANLNKRSENKKIVVGKIIEIMNNILNNIN